VNDESLNVDAGGSEDDAEIDEGKDDSDVLTGLASRASMRARRFCPVVAKD
jgi:hypothetical protein